MSGTKQEPKKNNNKIPFCYHPDAKQWSELLSLPLTVEEESVAEKNNTWFTIVKTMLKDIATNSFPPWECFLEKGELDDDGNVNLKKQTKKRKKPSIFKKHKHKSENDNDHLEERNEAKRKGIQVEDEDEDEDEGNYTYRTRRIRIFPTKEQITLLNQWFGATRLVYNNLVDKLGSRVGDTFKIKEMREVTDNFKNEKGKEFLKDVPYAVCDSAVRDFYKAKNSHYASLKEMEKKGEKGTEKYKKLVHSKFKFRSRKDRTQSFEVHANDWNRSERSIFSKIFHRDVLKTHQKLPEIKHTTRIVKDRLGRFFVCVPTKIEIRSENQAPPEDLDNVVSLDPGVRIFQCAYDGKRIIKFAPGDVSRLYRILLGIDDINRKLDELKEEHGRKVRRRRRRLRLARLRQFEKARNLVREVHWKVANYLCQNYRVILIPEFKTSQMVFKRGKKKRAISKRVCRQLMSWSHYSFKQILKQKAELYPWVKIIECTEEWTSKCCPNPNCMKINRNLGPAKTFVCPKCGIQACRDANASRSILIKYLTEHQQCKRNYIKLRGRWGGDSEESSC